MIGLPGVKSRELDGLKELFLNGDLVSNPYTNVLGAGTYTFLVSVIETQNYTSASAGGPGSIDGTIIVDKNDFNYCDNNESCVWYVENRGDPAGGIHCTGINYSKTCSSCGKLLENQVKSLPSSFKCFCNSNNRCQESR